MNWQALCSSLAGGVAGSLISQTCRSVIQAQLIAGSRLVPCWRLR